MAELEGTHHFSGDGCAELGRSDQVDRLPSAAKVYADRERIYVEDLEESDVFQWPGDGPLTWWYAQEVVILGGDSDTVHIEYSEAHPHG